MIKFIRKIFYYLLFGSILVFGLSYYYDLRLDSVSHFFADLKSTFFTSKQNPFSENNDDPNIKKMDIQNSDENLYKKIDRHARACPDAVEGDIKSLAAYLSEVADNDIEKARVIYVWLTDNISYDDVGYNSGDYGDLSITGILRRKTAVCDGFSTLFLALGSEMGLEINKVVGYAKGYSLSVGKALTETNHAWNTIKINGEWRVFDATWGQGNATTNAYGEMESKKEFNAYWFNVDPYQSIFNHLPEKSSDAHVSPSINLATYNSLPSIDAAYFTLGFDGKETYEDALSNKKTVYPSCYDLKIFAKIKSAPKHKALYIGKNYNFELYIPVAEKLAIIDSDGNFTYFEGDNGLFQLDYTPKNRGKLKINVKYSKGGDSFWSLLIYEVQKESLLG